MSYYVTAQDEAGRYALVSGPYETHERALALVNRAAMLADDEWPGAWCYRWGTCNVHSDASGALQRAGWDADLRERAAQPQEPTS